MTTYETEEQQLEAIKQWWKKNSKSIISGLVLGLLILLGGRYWVQHQQQQELAAAMEYEQLRVELQADNQDAVGQRVRYIQDTFPDSPYAVQAALGQARSAVDGGKLADAVAPLRWVIEYAGMPEFKAIARLRLARVLMAKGQQVAALAVLEQSPDRTYSSAFLPAYEETKGDIYVSMGRSEEARQAYVKALAVLPAEEGRSLLQMKLDDLGGALAS